MNKENLLKAIDLAKGNGECKYVVDGEPCCVIAQLFVLEGGTVEEMRTWASEDDYGQHNDDQISEIDYSLIKKLEKYDMSLLSRLQAIWDYSYITKNHEAETREAMRLLVNDFIK